MSLKITLKEINNSIQALNYIKDIDFEVLKPCPTKYPKFNSSKISYDIKKIIKVIWPEIELISEAFKENGKKYSQGKTKKSFQKMPDGSVTQIEVWDIVDSDAQEKYDRENKEFLATEIELNITKLKYCDFGRSLTADILFQLDYLIDGEDEAETASSSECKSEHK